MVDFSTNLKQLPNIYKFLNLYIFSTFVEEVVPTVLLITYQNLIQFLNGSI